MIARDYIADKLKADHPDFVVDRYPRSGPENLARGRTYVQVYRTNVSRSAEGLTHDLEIVVIVAKQVSNQAEIDLEGALDDVLVSLEDLDGVTWSAANRDIFLEQYGCYTITASLVTNNAYRTAVLTN